MALNVAQLRNQIQAVFDKRLPDTFQIASKIAKAYYSYAVAAQSPPGSPVILKGFEARVLESELARLMNARLQGVIAAQALGRAVTMFWMSPPVMNAAGGAVTAVITTSGIAKMAAVNVSDSRAASASLAQSFDIMTRLVFVTNPPPLPSGVLF